jgi:hypothetical protein
MATGAIELVTDGHPLLNGVKIASIGCDTVILFHSSYNTLYINAHLKDYKPGDAKFPGQMTAILTIISGNKDKQVVLMGDTNSQFAIDANAFSVYSKNLPALPAKADKFQRFAMEEGVTLSGIISELPTSNKMRGPHTAQLDKSLIKVKASIDHILTFNGNKVTKTSAYVLNESSELTLVTNADTMTTSPVSIADHALVISKMADASSVGTLNIKGGDPEDKAWAEFVPQSFLDSFDSLILKARLDELLTESFTGFTLAEIKAPDFTSKPRMSILDINLPNTVAPVVEIDNENINISSSENTYILSKQSDVYVCDTELTPEISWLKDLLKDLNVKPKEENTSSRDVRRTFFLEKGYKLLNYWHNVQNDKTDLGNGKTLSEIYDSWFTLSQTKVSIGEMIKQAKRLHPELKIMGIQELPLSLAEASPIIREIEALAQCKIYYTPEEINLGKDCKTRGGILVFTDKPKGGSRKRNKKNSRKSTRRRHKRKL